MTANDDIQRQEQIFRDMAKENPVLLELCERLNLTLEVPGRPVIEGRITQADREVLSGLAERFLKRRRIYTSDQIVSLFAVGLSISRDRAENGLNMMIQNGILTVGQGRGISIREIM